MWSVLAALHLAEHNPDRLSNYTPYENTLDISGLTFPFSVKDVPKFEKQNPSLSVNDLCGGDEDGFVPLYVSKERDRTKPATVCGRKICTVWMLAEQKLVTQSLFATIVYIRFTQNKSTTATSQTANAIHPRT